MIRKLTVCLATTLCLLLPVSLIDQSPLRAWSNGSSGPNSYGTHDWILDKAIRTLKRRGNRADWVKLQTALWATDDPDVKNGIDHASGTWWHVYDVWGEKYGGAPEAITVWFKRAAKRLASGQRRKASRALGILAHLLGDLANPMHTDQTRVEDRIHSSYEEAVDDRTRKRGGAYKFHYDGRHSGKPGRKAKHVARASHRLYKRLVRAYNRNGYGPYVHRLTRRQLDRGANAVADVAGAIKAAAKRIRNQGGGGGGGGGGGNCSPAYPDFCIPPPPPDLDCGDVNGQNFTVRSPDPHGFDSDGDGVGCET